MKFPTTGGLTRSFFLGTNLFLNNAQYCFRRNFSCETQFLLLTNDFFVNLDPGYPTIAVFLNFAKSFDRMF